MNNLDSYQNKEIESCLQSLSKKEMSSLIHVYDRFRKPVFILALSIVKDYCLAEDIMQEVFLKLIINHAKYKNITKIKTWILTVTRNLSIDYLRKLKHEEVDDKKLIGIELEDNTLNNYIFQDMLKKLNVDEKTIVILKLQGGFRYKEIAEVMGTSCDNTRKIYSRAIKKLRQQEDLKGAKEGV